MHGTDHIYICIQRVVDLQMVVYSRVVCLILSLICLLFNTNFKALLTTEPRLASCLCIMTSTAFKQRFRNHLKSFNSFTYANETRLSKYVCGIKEAKPPLWHQVVHPHSPAYKSGENHCSLCSTEKFFIIKGNKNLLIPKQISSGKVRPRARQTGTLEKSKRARARTHA